MINQFAALFAVKSKFSDELLISGLPL